VTDGRSTRAYWHIIRSILRVEVSSITTPSQIRKPRTTVDNPWSALVELLLRDPHVLEGRQAGKNGPSNPNAVLAFRRGDHSHSHTVRRKVGELFAHAVGDAGVHGRSIGDDNVAVPRGDWVRKPHIEGNAKKDSQVAPLIASNTTQYPCPVHDKPPFCCPDIHSSAPIVNSTHEDTSLVRNAPGRDMTCPNIELNLDVLGVGRLAAVSVPAGLSGSTFKLGNAVDAGGAGWGYETYRTPRGRRRVVICVAWGGGKSGG